MALIQELDTGTPIRFSKTTVTLTIDGQEVTVTASSSAPRQLQTGPRSSFNAQDVETLPSFSRDFKDLARLNPFVVIDTGNTAALQIAGPLVAVSDYMRAVPLQMAHWVPGDYHVLGADGFGFADTRPAARRFFNIDAEAVVVQSLLALAEQGKMSRDTVKQAAENAIYQLNTAFLADGVLIAVKAGAKVAPDELVEWCKARMAAYKYPRLVQVIDELPKTPTGKILRRELRG